MIQASAQMNITVNGIIVDSAGMAIPKATIQIGAEEDSITIFSNDNGQFRFSITKRGKFDLTVTMKGYVTYKKKFKANGEEATLQLNPIVLKINYLELEPVTVVRVKPFTIINDTINFHAAAFKIREGDEIESLIKRFPGVQVDMDGDIVVQGKKVARVMVDGKAFFGGNVQTAIRNLPADIVDKIQVIDDYGDKARLTGIKADESVKVLNIVLKQDKQNGKFGHLQAGVGNYGKYIGDGFANAFSGERQLSLHSAVENNNPTGNTFGKQLEFSYEDRWNQTWKQEGTMSLYTNLPTTKSRNIQDSYFSTGSIHQEQTNLTKGTNQSMNVNEVLTYSPNTFLKIRITPTISYQRSSESEIGEISTLQTVNGSIKTSLGNSLNTRFSKALSGGTELYIEKILPSNSVITIQVNSQLSSSTQNNNNRLTSQIQNNTQTGHSIQDYLIKGKNSNWNLGLFVNYLMPVGKKGFLELGYGYSLLQSKNKRITSKQDSIGILVVDSLSQQYLYGSVYQHSHTAYRARFNHINLNASMDLQPGYLTGNIPSKDATTKYRYFSILPSLRLIYEATHGRTFSLQYNGTPQLPDIQQVQPITDLSDPQHPISGNPALTPAFMHDVSVQFHQSSIKSLRFQSFSTTIGVNVVRNAIIQKTTHPMDTSAVIERISYANVNGIYSMYASYNFSFPAFLHKHLTIALNGTIRDNRFVSMTDGSLYTTKGLNATQSMHLKFFIPDLIESDVSANYAYSSTHYPTGISKTMSFSTANWALQNKHYLFHSLTLNYKFSQILTSNNGHQLLSNPILANASIEWQFMRGNRATLSLMGYDLFNSATGLIQSISPSYSIRNNTYMVGRYFIASFLLKWSKFKK
jgi:hypothetical protein